jgi:hypothetical protein
MSDRYNFAAKLNAIRPAPAPAVEDESRLDTLADQHGFVSREAASPPLPEAPMEGARGEAREVPREVPRGEARGEAREAIAQLHIHAPASVAARFKAYCRANRYPFWEGIDTLLKRQGR